MKYWLDSIRTLSYWRYAVFSVEAASKFFTALGVLFLLVEVADTFKVYTKDQYSEFGVVFIILPAALYVISTRRPVSRVRYKPVGRDITFEVKIGDIFSEGGEIIVSSNSTFDTDMASGLISAKSLQGQVATKFFNGQTDDIDRMLDHSLIGVNFSNNDARPKKKKEYPLGTVARVAVTGKNLYFVAMSHMNSDGTAYTSVKMLDEALEALWENMASKAEHGDLAISLMGTGRGRIAIPRKKVVEKIAQSFADASRNKTFSNKLTIVVHPEDASRFSLNLHQIRDYLSQSLHV